MNQLVITSPAGEPKNPKTWSGTPSNIARELEQCGIEVRGIDTGLGKAEKIKYRLMHLVSGYGSNQSRGRGSRTRSAEIVQQQIKSLNCNRVLHTSTLDLPAPQSDRNLKHYLFCDTTWNLWSQYVTNIDGYSTKAKQLYERLEREAYAQIEHFFVTAEYVGQNLRQHYQIEAEKITVVGTGRGKIASLQQPKQPEPYILLVAKERFEDKGGFLLLDGFELARQQNLDLKLVIVGQDKYQQLVGARQNVVVRGFIPWDELESLFHRAALFAMPALNEPWGIVYLEALACQTPILGLNRNSLPDITCHGKYGFLVDDPTPEAIAREIIAAFSEPEKLRQMGILGQEYCLKTFSWEKVARQIARVIFNI